MSRSQKLWQTNLFPALVSGDKYSKDSCTSWKTLESDVIKSTVGGFQIFSDRSHVSLSTGALQIYTILIILFNFSEERRRVLITSRRAVLASLTVIYEDSERRSHKKSLGATKSRYFSKVHRRRALHESIERCLKPI